MLLIPPSFLLFLSQSSSLLTSMQSSSEVPSAAELVSAIEKLVKTKMVSGFAGVRTHNCAPQQKSQFRIGPARKTCRSNPGPKKMQTHFAFFLIAKLKLNMLNFFLKKQLTNWRNLLLTSIIFLCWWIFVFMLVCIQWSWCGCVSDLSDFISEV